MRLNLFEGSGSDDDDDNNSKIEINKEFARRFEYNKNREELQRLEELKKKGLAGDSSDESDEDDDEEDEDDLIVSGKKDLEFFNALIKVKNRDPILKQKDAKLFEHEDDDEEEEAEEEEEEEGKEKKPRSKKDKPMYLKDVVAKHLIEEGPEFEEGNAESDVKSYAETQEELRRALLNAAEEDSDGDDGELFKVKKGNQGEDGEDAEDGNDDAIQKRLDEYFGEDENLDEKQMFLKNFFLNKMWVGKDDKGLKPSDADFLVSEDEEEIEKQDKYEAEYNFRYEEGAGDRVLGHSRITEGSVRKKENARKLQRKSKKERMAQAELERKEELKQLKNLKKKEITEKLQKIQAIAGIAEGGACTLDEDDLEEEFDPEEFDRKMKQMFDEDYYEAEDVDPDFCSDQDEDDHGLRKPNFEKEDELLGLPKGWDSGGSTEGFLPARENALQNKPDTSDVECSDDQDKKEEEELHEGGKRKRKRKISLKDKAWDEYYNLDYEDTIGDIKTRFKYTSVPPKRFGLSAAEVLVMDDKDLNQYVSLKKIAPYQEKEWKVPRIKRYEQKMKNKMLLQGENVNVQKAGMKHRSKLGDLTTTSATGSKEQEEALQLNGDVGTSKGIKRRRRHAELKLSHSRLVAYGKIPAKSKNKKKH